MAWKTYARKESTAKGIKRNGATYYYHPLTRDSYEELFEDLMEYYEINPYQEGYLKDRNRLKKRMRYEDSSKRNHEGQTTLSNNFMDKVIDRGYSRSQRDQEYAKTIYRTVKGKRVGKQLYTNQKGNLVYRSVYQYRNKSITRWRDLKGHFASPPVKYTPSGQPPEIPQK